MVSQTSLLVLVAAILLHGKETAGARVRMTADSETCVAGCMGIKEGGDCNVGVDCRFVCPGDLVWNPDTKNCEWRPSSQGKELQQEKNPGLDPVDQCVYQCLGLDSSQACVVNYECKGIDTCTDCTCPGKLSFQNETCKWRPGVEKDDVMRLYADDSIDLVFVDGNLTPGSNSYPDKVAATVTVPRHTQLIAIKASDMFWMIASSEQGFVTDGNWKCINGRKLMSGDDWTGVTFDDSSWPNARLVNGGERFPGTAAKHIWATEDSGTIYCRARYHV